MSTLYDHICSGNCCKVRLLISMPGMDYRRIPTHTTAAETLTEEYRRLNPRRQVPVLVDAGTLI